MPKIIIEKEMLKINMQKIRLEFITYNIINIVQIYSYHVTHEERKATEKID